MPEALALVKRELGEDALILGTRSCARNGLGGLVGATGVEITATVGETEPARTPVFATAGRLAQSDGVCRYYEHLVRNEVADELARRVADQAARAARGQSDADIKRVLRDTIEKMVPVVGGVELTPGRTRRVALVGPAGAGKTTTLAKLAAHFKLKMKKRVAILSLDMHRLGGDDQMRRYADVLGVDMKSAQTVSAVKDALGEFGDADLVLIDTHGVSGADRGHYARLAAVLRAARPDEIHLVLPVSMHPRVQSGVAARFKPLGVSRVVLTHLDEAVGLGVVLNAIGKLEWGISYVSDGETVPHHLAEGCARRIADLAISDADGEAAI
jgi:flagellar biosynthesis protein FlhF